MEENNASAPQPVQAPAEVPVPGPSSKDLPKSIIIMLVVVSVIVSLLGTWTVLEESSRLKTFYEPAQKYSVENGEVSVTILEQPAPAVSQATGKVSFQIIEGEQ